IVAFSYKKHGSIGCNVNRATIQEWQRLLVKRHYDENGFNKIERLSHFAMILSLSKFLDGQFPGRQTPW
ncbi:MAG: hypothetical protein ORO03_01430, partial [Alphaproteobacteria bacterium]|nr:hypothetical protein [Alphaproteobacteria bacterium]